MVKNLPANAEDVGLIPVYREDPLEEGMATHFGTLAWEILQTEEPGGLQSIPWGHKRVRYVLVIKLQQKYNK